MTWGLSGNSLQLLETNSRTQEELAWLYPVVRIIEGEAIGTRRQILIAPCCLIIQGVEDIQEEFSRVTFTLKSKTYFTRKSRMP